MPETVKFLANKPETLTLSFDDGVPCQSPYSGDQVRYSINDGRTLYASPALAEAITRAGIRRFVPFTVVKRSTRNGTHVGFEWVVTKVLEDGTGTASNSPAPASASKVSSSQNDTPSNHTPDEFDAHMNGNGHTGRVIPFVGEAALAAHNNGVGEADGDKLYACCLRAVDLAAKVKKYAQDTHGILLEPRYEDIRAAAATLYINAQGGRR